MKRCNVDFSFFFFRERDLPFYVFFFFFIISHACCLSSTIYKNIITYQNRKCVPLLRSLCSPTYFHTDNANAFRLLAVRRERSRLIFFLFFIFTREFAFFLLPRVRVRKKKRKNRCMIIATRNVVYS